MLWFRIRFTNKNKKQSTVFLMASDSVNARCLFTMDHKGQYTKINKIDQRAPIKKRIAKVKLTPRI